MRIAFETVQAELRRVLLARDCPPEHAQTVAYEMARSSLEGTYSHGINRFPRLIDNIDQGLVNVHATPETLHGFGAIENMDGRQGLGIVNARLAMDRAIALARVHGIGFVAMGNTNHWMRAATYGYQACESGMAGICFSNTLPNMPTWGAVDARLGNNPLVFAFPHPSQGHLLIDMAMSQYSYGAMEVASLQGRQMPTDAGFDASGRLTRAPEEVLASKRTLPMGYWKGAALSFILDIFAGCMSLGRTSAEIGKLGAEYGVSQCFFAIHYSQIAPKETADAIAQEAIDFLLASEPVDPGKPISYPGQRAKRVREENLRLGIPVDESVWQRIVAL